METPPDDEHGVAAPESLAYTDMGVAAAAVDALRMLTLLRLCGSTH